MARTSRRRRLPKRAVNAAAWVLDALRLRARYVSGPHGFDPAVGLQVDVGVYYPDGPAKLYQLTQWLPVFQNHPSDLTFGLVVRSYQSFLELQSLTTLPIAHVPSFADLMELYRVSSMKGLVYVNNGVGNFQSLAAPELAHVHVNHGESDKICMVSNQVKAYDRVFVAGEAAVQRHRAALSEFNEDLLVRVGRPQLDEHPSPGVPASDRVTLLYAPTWAGEDEANNYTSMEAMGPEIMRACLAQSNVRVLYKPHPRVLDSSDPRISANNAAIIRDLTAAQRADPAAGHAVFMQGDILSLFPRTDVLISDVSSVALDFLYLRPESPIILTDRLDDVDRLRIESPLSMATEVITPSNVSTAYGVVSRVIGHDDHRDRRERLRTFYFDNVKSGQSTERFFTALKDAIRDHSTDMARAQDLARRGTAPQLTPEG